MSPDGKRAASSTRHEVILHRIPDLTETARLNVPTYVGNVGSATLAFSGDGRRVALHTALGRLVVWDLPQLSEELRAMGFDPLDQ